MYIDETGNPDLDNSENPNHRFLTLTGIAIDCDYVKNTIYPELENLKSKFFHQHPDEPICLHRKDIVQTKGVFSVLKDEKVRQAFDQELINLLSRWNYTVFSVVIDKLEHKNQYKTWRYDPYHYCMEIIIERYVLFLRDTNNHGDVMAESRGGKEDIRLKKAYERLYNEGTNYLDKNIFQQYLTSTELKVKGKAANISGLQIADIIAHPSRLDMLKSFRLMDTNMEVKFANEIIRIITDKYYKKGNKINGYGMKKLP